MNVREVKKPYLRTKKKTHPGSIPGGGGGEVFKKRKKNALFITIRS